MHANLTAEQRTPRPILWTHRIVNGIFGGAIASTIVVCFIVARDGNAALSTATWGYAYLLVFSLFAALMLSTGLLIHAIGARTLAFVRWPFVLFVLTVLVMNVSERVTDRLNGDDTVPIRLMNESVQPIQAVEIFGRGEGARIDSIPAKSAVVVRYRGREINFKTRDWLSNRIRVRWVAAGLEREQIIVDQMSVFNDSLIVVFPAPDSVRVGQPEHVRVIAK